MKDNNCKYLKYIFILVFVFFLIPNTVFAGTLDECREYLGEGVVEILETVYTAIRIATPILIVFLISIDLVKAVTAGKEEDIKKAQSAALKRLIIGVVIFFVPTIVNLLLGLFGLIQGTCGLG